VAKIAEKIIFADNKKALFDYEIIEEYEAGLKLYGEEVKSIRNGSINLKGSYILINKNHPYAVGIHIGEYK
jgi:SsrA-binding protein